MFVVSKFRCLGGWVGDGGRNVRSSFFLECRDGGEYPGNAPVLRGGSLHLILR